MKEEGPSYLLERISRIDDPIWSPWFEHLSRRLKGKNSVPKEVSEALSVMGVLGLALVWVVEGVGRLSLERKDQELQVKNYLHLLFAEKEKQAHPRRSVVKVLEHAFEKSGCEAKIQFIHQAFGSSESQVREAKRFFSGSAIPSHSQTMRALETSIDMVECERRTWVLCVMVAQLMARSTRHLEKLASASVSDAHQPHFKYYEVMRTVLDGRSAPSSPSA